MGNEVDYYDVQNMIRDERYQIMGDVRREIEEAKAAMRSEFRDEIEALRRVLNARTEHMV